MFTCCCCEFRINSVDVADDDQVWPAISDEEINATAVTAAVLLTTDNPIPALQLLYCECFGLSEAGSKALARFSVALNGAMNSAKQPVPDLSDLNLDSPVVPNLNVLNDADEDELLNSPKPQRQETKVAINQQDGDRPTFVAMVNNDNEAVQPVEAFPVTQVTDDAPTVVQPVEDPIVEEIPDDVTMVNEPVLPAETESTSARIRAWLDNDGSAERMKAESLRAELEAKAKAEAEAAADAKAKAEADAKAQAELLAKAEAKAQKERQRRATRRLKERQRKRERKAAEAAAAAVGIPSSLENPSVVAPPPPTPAVQVQPELAALVEAAPALLALAQQYHGNSRFTGQRCRRGRGGPRTDFYRDSCQPRQPANYDNRSPLKRSADGNSAEMQTPAKAVKLHGAEAIDLPRSLTFYRSDLHQTHVKQTSGDDQPVQSRGAEHISAERETDRRSDDRGRARFRSPVRRPADSRQYERRHFSAGDHHFPDSQYRHRHESADADQRRRAQNLARQAEDACRRRESDQYLGRRSIQTPPSAAEGRAPRSPELRRHTADRRQPPPGLPSAEEVAEMQRSRRSRDQSSADQTRCKKI